MTNPHFYTGQDWQDAEAHLTFEPKQPRFTAGQALLSLQIFVRDHRQRDLPPGETSLEAHYGAFVLSQSQTSDARRQALETSYGRDPREVLVAGHEGRAYDLGPEPEPGDIDGRVPAVVTWSDGDRFYLVASGELSAEDLLAIGASIY